MLINADARALEIVCAAYLSQDPVLCKEIRDSVDVHSVNQKALNLPTRLIAKTFIFRLIYGGSAYSYANDPEFTPVSTSEKYWQGVIDEFYTKYVGVAEWHASLIREATTTGKLRMPTGRVYYFDPSERRGDLVWPTTKILNYPVQGLGADLMCLARVSFFRRFKEEGITGKLLSTIHDSIVLDTPKENLDKCAQVFMNVFNDIPKNFERLFRKEFNLSCTCEISYGPNKKDLTTYEF